MRFSDLMIETFASLTGNKVRSGLTILGLVVGIASVIAMVAVGEGSKAAVTSRFQSVGANQLTVRPSSPDSGSGQVRRAAGDVQSLTRDDADAIAQIFGCLGRITAVIELHAAGGQVEQRERAAHRSHPGLREHQQPRDLIGDVHHRS